MTRTIQKSITIQGSSKHLPEVRTLIAEALAETEAGAPVKESLSAAVEDVVTSIVDYSRFKGFISNISLTLDINDVRFKAVVADSMNAFDMKDVDLELHSVVDREREHSLGILGLRQVMDEISYTYRKGFENQLELIKFL